MQGPVGQLGQEELRTTAGICPQQQTFNHQFSGSSGELSKAQISSHVSNQGASVSQQNMLQQASMIYPNQTQGPRSSNPAIYQQRQAVSQSNRTVQQRQTMNVTSNPGQTLSYGSQQQMTPLIINHPHFAQQVIIPAQNAPSFQYHRQFSNTSSQAAYPPQTWSQGQVVSGFTPANTYMNDTQQVYYQQPYQIQPTRAAISTPQPPQQQQTYPKRQKNILQITDPSTGKVINDEIISSSSKSANTTSNVPIQSTVRSTPPTANSQHNVVAAQFAAQVAATLKPSPDRSSPQNLPSKSDFSNRKDSLSNNEPTAPSETIKSEQIIDSNIKEEITELSNNVELSEKEQTAADDNSEKIALDDDIVPEIFEGVSSPPPESCTPDIIEDCDSSILPENDNAAIDSNYLEKSVIEDDVCLAEEDNSAQQAEVQEAVHKVVQEADSNDNESLPNVEEPEQVEIIESEKIMHDEAINNIDLKVEDDGNNDNNNDDDCVCSEEMSDDDDNEDNSKSKKKKNRTREKPKAEILESENVQESETAQEKETTQINEKHLQEQVESVHLVNGFSGYNSAAEAIFDDEFSSREQPASDIDSSAIENNLENDTDIDVTENVVNTSDIVNEDNDSSEINLERQSDDEPLMMKSLPGDDKITSLNNSTDNDEILSNTNPDISSDTIDNKDLDENLTVNLSNISTF